MRKLMLSIAVSAIAALGGLALAGDSGAGSKKMTAHRRTDDTKVKLRSANRKLYNAVYQASLLQEPRQAKKAFALLQQKMEKANPQDKGDVSVGQALFQRGYLAMETRDYKGAIRLFEELVKRFPKHAYADDALYQIGYIYQNKLKDYDKAAAAYDRVAKSKEYRKREIAPNVQYQNAQVAVQQGRVADMVENLNDSQVMAGKQRFERDQTSVPSYYEKRSQQLLKFIGRNTDKDSKKGQKALTLWMRGNMDLQQGKVQQAEGNFTKLQKDYAKSKLADDAAFGLAECRRRALKLDEAAKLYAAFIAKYPKSEYAPLAKFRLAEIKRVAGDNDAAGKLYEAARDDIAKMVAEGLKKKPPIRREDISPEIRRVLELSKDRMMEMGKARVTQ